MPSHQARRGSIATPWPLLWRMDHARPHWIQGNLARQLQHVRFLLHKNRLEPALKQVASAMVMPV